MKDIFKKGAATVTAGAGLAPPKKSNETGSLASGLI